ncbi:phosphotransferase [Spongiibacter sp. KMU-158]|uniref:Phosphotransferase n=1 Tax=Spongiibacter pelagi TaxID=2760804 RepID=A0A927GXJ5_9GAMM|nr:AarF/UbiB family protein [Spongiibacter pelagi]MBD2859489.1 phosphotransferase [Spongiibacter pelagi]
MLNQPSATSSTGNTVLPSNSNIKESTSQDRESSFANRARNIIKSTRAFTLGTTDIYRAITPLAELVNRDQAISEAEMRVAADRLFNTLSEHPLVGQLRDITNGMRSWNLLPNEQSTENLINLGMKRFSAVTANIVPTEVTDEFWNFFNELASEPELNGLGEIGLDIAHIIYNTYEPLIVSTLNQLKEMRQHNDEKTRQVLGGVYTIRGDLLIFRRQIKALRHIRTFFNIPEDDYKAQADLVAMMVREFGPFFIKIAQVAAANTDFLPEEISEALAVFQEDVEPMSAQEVEQAFIECFNQKPERLYYDFDASKPLKSGSIASVYSAYRPVFDTEQPERVKTLVPVLLKVGRHNLEREFLIGKTVIKLFILTSQYWAPHTKLTPFLHSWLDQTDIFVEGFREELDFEAEAKSQQRFAERARYSSGWYVPEVYQSTRRIIEMELIENANSLNKAFDGLSKRQSRQLRRRTARNYLHAMIHHLLINQEFHGDLHQGNVLVKNKRQLYFIDWGNSVDIQDIWRPTVNYLIAVLSGDAQRVTDSIIEMSPAPAETRLLEADLLEIARQTFAKSGVKPLDIFAPYTLYREGKSGLMNRLEVAMTLIANISRKGISVKGEYLHLSRSLTAMSGSFFGLYKDLPRMDLLRDLAQVWLQFPSKAGFAYIQGNRRELISRLSSSD